MTPLRPDTVAIHRLHVRRGAGMASARAEQEATRLRQEIEWADWPEAPGESWVFIRQLQSRAPRGQLVHQLLQDAHEQLYSGSGDNVMRFADLTELLAALLTDLVRGEAPRRWYWQRWSHLLALPLSRAIASLLTDHIAHLPAVCARLSRHRTLEQVWLALDEAGASQLEHTLAWRGGFSLPQWQSIQKAQTRIRLTQTPEDELRISHTIRTRWEALLQRLSRQDSRHRLGLLLIGQEIAPLMLQQAPASLLARLDRAFVRLELKPRSSNEFQPTPPAAQSTDPGIDDGSTPTISGETSAASPHRKIEPKSESENGPPALLLQENPPPEGIIQVSSQNNAVCHAGGSAAAIHNSHTPPPTDRQVPPCPGPPSQTLLLHPQADDLAFDQFHTCQGGLLYLLNMLNRSEAQSLMKDLWTDLPNGWGWLYRLGQELRMDETDPLVTFLAAQLGFDHPTDLEILPPLPGRAELLGLARRWYGRAGLWQPSLLCLSASIHVTPSHVDLYAPLAAVHLQTRLAGLDINPGWLPWLGRVVSFHYD